MTVKRASRSEATAAALIEVLRNAFDGAGWNTTIETPPLSFIHHILIKRGDMSFALVLRVTADARQHELKAFLADAVVRARVLGTSRSATPLALVGAPTLSDRQSTALHDYARTYLTGSAYGLVDLEGRIELVDDELRNITYPLRLEPTALRPAPALAFTPFSDVNQWLLKVLFAQRLPEALLTAPRAVAKNPHRLAKLAGVAPATAHRFAKVFKARGFLIQERGALRLVDERRLFEEWRSATTTDLAEHRLTWLLPSSDADEQLETALEALQRPSTLPKPRVCLALYSAADRLGFHHVSGVAPHLYHQDPSIITPASLGAVESEPQSRVDLLIRQPSAPTSVFRGAVEVDGVPCSDIIQTWLDTFGHSARGEEQADYIWRRVLSPVLEA